MFWYFNFFKRLIVADIFTKFWRTIFHINKNLIKAKKKVFNSAKFKSNQKDSFIFYLNYQIIDNKF